MPSRRTFILSGLAATGGLVLAYGYRQLDDGDAAEKFAAAGNAGIPLNAWLKIDPAGTITCAIHRAEMGQGIVTTLAMLLAEELDANWSDIAFEFAPVDRDYYNFGMLLNGQPLGDPASGWAAATGTWAIRQVFHALGMSMTISSSSTIDAWDTLRPAGATARQMLLQAAGRQWAINPNELVTNAGYVINPANDQRLSYGALAEAAARERPPGNVQLKDPADYKLVGTNVARLDTPLKVTGRAHFGADVNLPGMRYAVIKHSPRAGSTVAGFAANGAMEMAGVQSIVKAGIAGQEKAVAVVAGDTWQALQAAERIRIVAQPGAGQPVDSDTLAADYFAMLDSASATVFRADGRYAEDIDALSSASPDYADTAVSADYLVPMLAHACMEPMNCTARFDGTTLELWAPTQAQSIARDYAARACGLQPEQVVVHTTFLGGGFGRRAEMDFIEQAASVAVQLPGAPIRLIWPREEDLRHDAYRPMAACRIRGITDGDGNIDTLDLTLVCQSVVASYEARTPTPRGGEAATDKSVVEAANPPLYPVSNLRVRYVPVELEVPAGYWRSVSHSWTTFFIESFVDELATGAGIDPLEFRRHALRDQPRHRAVLDLLATKLGARSGDGTGFAVAESHGTVVAHAIEVVAPRGRFERVTRVVCVIDCGPVVHPDNVVAQMESSIIDGLSAALYGRIDIRDGQVIQGNFDDYRLLRMDEAPLIEVWLAAPGQKRPGGVGEPGVPGVAPALTNAIYAATGTRIRTLPVQNPQPRGKTTA